ncbi:MAG: 8-amino-7-oxononanoate synthase [Muribaculaceae bacterium]|nr:8-amino-7-oxononanoate synthase [Muribaculaceae bacterium]
MTATRIATSRLEPELEQLRQSSNFRSFPEPCDSDVIDLTSNDYLGLALRDDLKDEFLGLYDGGRQLELTSSASRLLASCQNEYRLFETMLGDVYGRPALLFNSGYHANTGIVQALADKRTMIVADKLVHASIIDGIRLSGARFTRFPHNDFDRLERIVAGVSDEFDRILVIVESVYSMDGDRADIDRLIDLRRSNQRVLLYVDEAHGIGVEGQAGLGLVASAKAPADVDIVIGTLGKALASSGAFAIVDDIVRQYLVNKARSLIFSTALPPACVAWSRFLFGKMMEMDSERDTLRRHTARLADAIAATTGRRGVVSHIQPLVIGNAAATLQRSAALLRDGIKVLPIRTPTVPPGSERLRFSLSAALTDADITRACICIEGKQP